MLAMNLNAEILNSCKRIVEIVKGDLKKRTKSEVTEEMIVNKEESVHVYEDQKGSEELGTVNLGNIAKSLFKSINLKYKIGLALFLCLLMFSRYYANFVTKMMLLQDFSIFLYLGLAAELVCPLLFYSILIISIQKMAG